MVFVGRADLEFSYDGDFYFTRLQQWFVMTLVPDASDGFQEFSGQVIWLNLL